MEKVIDIFGKEIEFDCMGCDIANHKLVPPGGYIYEDDFINVCADPEIPIKGFLVLGIKKHIKSINEMTKDERINVIESLNDSINAIKKAKVAEEVLLIQEEKAEHFHIWIVPMHEWMREIGRSVRNIKKFIDYAKEHFGEKEKEELLEAIENIKEVYGK